MTNPHASTAYIKKAGPCNGESFTRSGRFKGVAILDDEAFLAMGAYNDLNPVAAGIAEIP